MEIRQVHIANCHGIESETLNPAKLTFITGPSGSGKSSVMEAVRYSVCGKAAEGHVRAGCGEAKVTAVFDRLTVERTVKAGGGAAKVRCNGKSATAKAVAEMFTGAYGFNPTDADILMSSDALRHALGKDLASYLLNGGFLSNDMSFQKLLDINPLPDDVAEALEKQMFPLPELSKPRSERTVTLGSIDEAYTQLRASRPALKKLLAEETAQGKLTCAAPTRTVAEITGETLDVQMKLAAERRKAEEYPRALREAERVRGELENAKKELAAHEGVTAVTAREKELAEANIRKTAELAENAKSSIAALKSDIAMLEKTLDSLDTSVCPISAKLKCTTDKTAVKTELFEAAEMKKAQLASTECRLEKYGRELEEARRERDDLVKREGDYKIRLMLMKQIETLGSIKVAVPMKPDPETAEALEAQLERLRAEASAVGAYNSVLEHRKRADALSEQLSVTETLIKELAPNGGVRKRVLEHCIGPMEDICNENMALVLPKYKIRFDPDDDFNIALEDSLGCRLPFDAVSNGEQLRVVFLIMLMLNELNQVRVILMDNLNDLDLNAFRDFLRMLEGIDPSYYDHIFLAGIDHEGFVDAVESCSVPHVICRL